MGRANTLITNFTAGELSPRLDVRTDIKAYHNGANQIRNAIVLAHGGACKRPGSQHVIPTRTASFASRLERFQFSTTQAYVIEFASGYFRFYKDRAVITNISASLTGATKANPCVVTYSGSDVFTNGDQVLITGVGGMTELNNRIFTVANINTTDNTFELTGINSTGYTTYTTGGTAAVPVQLAHTYSDAEIDDLWVTQSADTMYIFHPSHPIRKLTRTSHTAWTLTAPTISAGPFRTINTDKTHYLKFSAFGYSLNLSGATKAKPVVVTWASSNFLEGACVTISGVSGMTQLNGNKYILRNITGSTAELWTMYETPVDGTAYSTYTSGGVADQSTTVFGTISPGTQLTISSSKALFTSSHVGALFRLWEPGQTSGVTSPAVDDDFAALAQYTHAGNVYGALNNTYGSGSAQWKAAWTYPTHTAGVVRISDGDLSDYHDSVYLHDSSCVLEVLSYSSSTSVTVKVVRNHVPLSVVGAAVGTNFWEEGAWSAVRGYPSVGTFHKSRLAAASSSADPQNFWASVVRSFENFQDGTDDDRAIIDQMLSDQVEVARWIASTAKALIVGTAGSIQAIFGSTTGDGRGLTPTNVDIKPQLPIGASTMRPVRVSDVLIYGERNGTVSNPARVLNEMRYDYNADGFIAPAVTVIAEHITGPGVTEGAFQATPNPVAWFRRTDGQIAGLTYNSDQDVRGWSLHSMGGATTSYSYGECKRLCSVPGADGDEIWMVVKRRINGADVHYIEFLTTGLTPTTDTEDCIYLDSALTYDSTSTSTITGLNHLIGQTVYALVDGAKQGPFTVSAAGKITLTAPGSLVHVGLKYLSVVESVDLDAAAQMGTAKTRAKYVSEVWPSFYRSLGGRMGSSASLMYDLAYRTDSDLFGTSPALKTDFIRHGFPGGWNRRKVLRFEHDEPYPFCLLGIAAELSTSG